MSIGTQLNILIKVELIEFLESAKFEEKNCDPSKHAIIPTVFAHILRVSLYLHLSLSFNLCLSHSYLIN